eukprot:1429-Heterococcus_DN1.PRE.1
MASTFRQPRMTAAYVDQMMVQRRLDERYQNDLKRYNHEVNVLSHAAANEQRMTYQRRANETARFTAEQMMDDQISAQEAGQRTHARLQEQNSRLAEELQRRRAETARSSMEVQRICAESEELKELEQRLKLAYLNKERSAQHADKQLVKRLQDDIEQSMADKMEHDRQQALRAEADKIALRRDMAADQRQALQRQMEEQKALMAEAAMQETSWHCGVIIMCVVPTACCNYCVPPSNTLANQEAERDREMVSAIVNAIEREEQEEAHSLMLKREQTRAMVRDAELQRVKQLELKKIRQAAEEADILRHNERLAQREAQIEEEKRKKKELNDQNFRAVVESTQKQRNEEDELRVLRDMLWEEELEAKLIQQDREKQAKIEHDKVGFVTKGRSHHK